MHLDDQIDVKNKSLPNSLLLNFKKNKINKKGGIKCPQLCITTHTVTEGSSALKPPEASHWITQGPGGSKAMPLTS